MVIYLIAIGFLTFFGLCKAECEPGSYQVGASTCELCNCSIGGSLGPECDVLSGECPCRSGVTGRTCSQPLPGYFFPSIDYLLFEAESSNGIHEPQFLTEEEGISHTGNGTTSVTTVLEPILRFGPFVLPHNGEYLVVIRYSLSGISFWPSSTLYIEGEELPVELLYENWSADNNHISNTACLRRGPTYTFILRDFTSGFENDATLDIDSLVIIPFEIEELNAFADPSIASEYKTCAKSWSSIFPQDPNCEDVTFIVSTEFYNGTLECDCNDIGSTGHECNFFGGQCSCLSEISGRQCDYCTPGTFGFSSSGCKECNCSKSGAESEICQTFDGQCGCLPNTDGMTCSQCISGFYNLTAGVGCYDCECNSDGSELPDCNQLDGRCACKNGVSGEKCDRCDDGYFGFSENGCSSCSCDDAGSIESVCDAITGQCTCRKNTNGSDCSTCNKGTFNLQSSNPDGCQPCFCSGLSTMCTSAKGFESSTVTSNFLSASLLGWQIFDDVNTDVEVTSSGLLISPNFTGYLAAPEDYIGNKLSSYNQHLIIQADVSSNVSETMTLNVELIGSGLKVSSNFMLRNLISIHLHEGSGWNEDISAYQFQLILFSLDQLLISFDLIHSIAVNSITLQTTSQNNNSAATWVEECNCPSNYSGLSCEFCTTGYTRTPSNTCELCQCNGFSNTCDPETGECLNCSGLTTGQSCEICVEGTFGDPLNGIECEPCPCPHVSGTGQFTNNCTRIDGEIRCIGCPEGHEGLQCELCANGYYGDPLAINSDTPVQCTACPCNNNIDLAIPESCNNETGVCLRCINNTAGENCESCAEGYFGDGTEHNCEACDCHPVGSINSSCHQQTGKCSCLPNVSGSKCTECLPDHFGFSTGNGCTPCNCGPASSSSICDEDTGECMCQPGVTGANCDTCLQGYYQLTSSGCQECLCSVLNSASVDCDEDGQCLCKDGATGDKCQFCLDTHYISPMGCTACPQCYQDISENVTIAGASLDDATTSIFDILFSTNPTMFSTRLDQKRHQVTSVINEIDSFQMQQDNINDNAASLEYSYFELEADVNQFSSSISDLKNQSLSLLTSAMSLSHFLNTHIANFTLVVNRLSSVEAKLVSNILNSSQSVHEAQFNSYVRVAELQSQLSNLSTQVDSFATISTSLMSVLLEVSSDISFIVSATQNSTASFNDLWERINAIQNGEINFNMQIQMLEHQISLIFTQIENFSFGLQLSVEELNQLLLASNQNENAGKQLLELAVEGNDELTAIIHQVTDIANLTQKLSEQLLNYCTESFQLSLRVNDSYVLLQQSFEEVTDALQQSHSILDKLLAFKNESSNLADFTATTLMDIANANESAIEAFAIAKNMQEEIERYLRTVTTAKQMIENKQFEEQIDQQNVSLIVDELTEQLSEVNETVKQLDSLESQADELELQTSPHTAIAHLSTLANASIQVVEETRIIHEHVNTALIVLENLLSDTSKTNQEKLESIQTIVMASAEKVFSNDIDELYNMLQDDRNKQANMKSQLQQELIEIKSEIESLALPECNAEF